MKTLGEGEARGGVSILHALGTGKGCSVGVNLLTRVKLVDKKSKNLQDEHKLLDSVIKCWKAEGFPLPKEYGWDIFSEVPIGQGLKSSSALACAAIKSLNSASWTNLNDFEIIDLAVKAQKQAGCTITSLFLVLIANYYCGGIVALVFITLNFVFVCVLAVVCEKTIRIKYHLTLPTFEHHDICYV